MKRPTSIKSLFAVILLMLGVAFLAESICLILGFILPDPDSPMNPTLIFMILSPLCFLFALLLALHVFRFDRAKQRIYREGLALDDGKIQVVQRLRYITFHMKHPYRIYYSYSYNGAFYHGKSRLIWIKPDMSQKRHLRVYIDKTQPSLSTLDLDQPFFKPQEEDAKKQGLLAAQERSQYG